MVWIETASYRWEIGMTTVSASRRPVVGLPWGVYVTIGALWLVLGWVVLRFNQVAVGTLALIAGLVLLGVGLFELVEAFTAPGWRWLHALLGVGFVALGVVVWVNPGKSFVWISALLALYLLVAGFVNVVVALATTRESEGWWLQLIVGIVEMLVGFWAARDWARSTTLLLLLIAAICILRGVTDIVLGFRVRRIQHAARDLGEAIAERELVGAGAAGRDREVRSADAVNPSTTARDTYGDAKARPESQAAGTDTDTRRGGG